MTRFEFYQLKNLLNNLQDKIRGYFMKDMDFYQIMGMLNNLQDNLEEREKKTIKKLEDYNYSHKDFDKYNETLDDLKLFEGGKEMLKLIRFKIELLRLGELEE